MKKTPTTKTPKMFNLNMYFKQGYDLNEYLEAHEKDVPTAVCPNAVFVDLTK